MSAPSSARPQRLRPHPLTQLAATLQAAPPSPPVQVTGAAHVAQAVRPGDLYLARPGASVHGAQFSAEAVAAGAVAILTDPAGAQLAAGTGVPLLIVPDVRSVVGTAAAWVYDEPSRHLPVLGITGTAGKTTTTTMIEAGLRAAGHTTGLIGGVRTLVAGEVVPNVRTTPEAPELQALLAAMLERGVTAATMEVSSHALSLGRVDGTRFAVGAFTNFSQDHLDFHRDMEDYFAAKSLLFDGRCRAEVLNIDDEWVRRLVRADTVTVSPSGDRPARWRAEHVDESGGVRFEAVHTDGRRIPVRLGLSGSFNVANALIALAAIDAAGFDAERAAAGFGEVTVPGRLERVDAGQDFLAIVDYAHKPGAVQSVLAALRPATKGALIIVLGCGGDRDRAKRPVMGAVAGRGADLVIVTDDNPRSEDPAAIRAEMEGGLRAAGCTNWISVPGRREAIAEAVGRARPGDTVVIAGKGHEQGQEIGGQLLPFDDRAVLRELIEGRA